MSTETTRPNAINWFEIPARNLDRIETLAVQNECFRDEAGKTLADLFRRVRTSPPTGRPR